MKHAAGSRIGGGSRWVSLARLLLPVVSLAAFGCTALPPATGSAAREPEFDKVSAPAAVGVVEPVAPAAYPVLSSEDAAAEAARLRSAFAHEVQTSGATQLRPQQDVPDSVRQAQVALARSDYAIDRPQLVVVVDRSPRAQRLFVVLARPQGDWDVLGSARISTGQPGRKDHYITPVGVFAHTDAILDFRAEGTFNENHIRGLGIKGMRVWDFGWQTATKGWRTDGEQGDIRLLMHATDPDYLEQRLGRPASQGCVRLPDAVNRFLDRHGVLDADYERAAEVDIRYRALLLPDRKPTPLAGDIMVVVDTAGNS